jgi:hypothetical protein
MAYLGAPFKPADPGDRTISAAVVDVPAGPARAGLGALEASQMLALQTLGPQTSYGISIALLIRLRDLLFGLVGILAVVFLFGWDDAHDQSGERTLHQHQDRAHEPFVG